MPGIADPGETLARAAIDAGIPVFPIPGANAALSALIASGLSPERFTFHGFLPAKEGQRRTTLERVLDELRTQPDQPAPTQVFYETPHRILEALTDIAALFGPTHRIALARELTKLHEEFLRGPVSEVLTTLQSRPAIRGEMVLLLDGRVVHRSRAGAPRARLPTHRRGGPLAACPRRPKRKGRPETRSKNPRPRQKRGLPRMAARPPLSTNR